MRRISLNAFQIATPGQHTSGSWRNPRARADRFTDLEYWTGLARTLERGRFDSLFLADVVGLYDVYGGSADAALRNAVQVPILDPFMLVSAMAATTSRLGFAVTSATTYEQPYALARKFSTLDHLTRGRIGFNVVTSYLESAARNLGLDTQLDHDLRYDMGDEFMEVVYKLWEGSWEDDSVIVDRAAGVFTDPSKVHPIGHEGAHYRVPGIHLASPSPQRTPVIFQAGGSPRGTAFAAQHGEGVFINGMRKDIAAKIVGGLRDEAERLGRPRDAIRIMQQMTVIVGDSDAAAERRLQEAIDYTVDEGSLALWGGLSGLDMSTFAPDQVLEYVDTNSIRSTLALLTTADPSKQWTTRDLVEFMRIGGTGPVLVGGPETIADEIEDWVEKTGIDGINLFHAVSPESYEEFVELVVPVLQRRGRVWTDYEGSTLREYYFGEGHRRVAEDHPAAAYRR
ncbi:MAG: LLM class flavin-dependent oxidoreductase [Leucobacter sp.]